jgi:hypothetical protein
VAQVVWCLLCKKKDLSSKPSAERESEREREREPKLFFKTAIYHIFPEHQNVLHTLFFFLSFSKDLF